MSTISIDSQANVLLLESKMFQLAMVASQQPKKPFSRDAASETF